LLIALQGELRSLGNHLSTHAAFRGQNAEEFTSLRVGVGYLVSVIVALAVHNLPLRSILRRGCSRKFPRRAVLRACENSLLALAAHWHVAVNRFPRCNGLFVLGVAVSALFSTAVNQEMIMPLALNDWIATFSLMGFAAILSLCSTSDAFRQP
jgi:uncharacterized membrane protein YraQ (UPF0718 family)